MLTQRPVRNDVAMTGEITLRGAVLPVGGIKEKVLAAKRAGLTHVILPDRNQKDLEDVPANVREGLTFHFIKRVDEIIDLAICPKDDEMLLPAAAAAVQKGKRVDSDKYANMSGPDHVN